jgi:hypothetical protein
VIQEFSMTPVGNCIFCDHVLLPSQLSVPHSRTEEHIFGKDFRRVTRHKIIYMYLGTVDDDIPELSRRPPLTALTMRGVCQQCNTGGMSKLETAVAPILERIFTGTDVDELSDSELELLARWTAKTAITLSYATPQQAQIPLQASHSLHPDYRGSVHFGFFYAKITADPPLESRHLQVLYGSELGLVGEVAGTRLALCLNGHCVIVDFPPASGVCHFDLRDSCCAQLWPVGQAAGVKGFKYDGPARVDRVLLALCHSITVQVTTAALRA